MQKSWTPLAMGVAIAVFGCGNGNYEEAKTVTNDVDVLPIAADDRTIADKAIQALADYLDLPVTAVSVDSVRAVDWRDSSIGCPQPGEAYMQVITPGHKITLRVDGDVYVVHEANGNAFVCVKRKLSASEVTSQLDIEWAPQAQIARKDLAKQLGVDESQVSIVSARAETWTDSSLGCADPGKKNDEIRSQGYVLVLRHGNENYTYHTDLDRLIACPASSEE